MMNKPAKSGLVFTSRPSEVSAAPHGTGAYYLLSNGVKITLEIAATIFGKVNLREPRESTTTLNWDEEVPPVDVVDAPALSTYTFRAANNHHADRECVVASVNHQLHRALRAFCQ